MLRQVEARGGFLRSVSRGVSRFQALRLSLPGAWEEFASQAPDVQTAKDVRSVCFKST